MFEQVKSAEAKSFQPSYVTKDILTMKEAAEFTGLSTSTLYKLTMKSRIPFSKPGGKMIFFKKSDLEAFLLGNMQKSKSQIVKEAEEFLLKNRKSQHYSDRFARQGENSHFATAKNGKNEA